MDFRRHQLITNIDGRWIFIQFNMEHLMYNFHTDAERLFLFSITFIISMDAKRWQDVEEHVTFVANVMSVVYDLDCQ